MWLTKYEIEHNNRQKRKGVNPKLSHVEHQFILVELFSHHKVLDNALLFTKISLSKFFTYLHAGLNTFIFHLSSVAPPPPVFHPMVTSSSHFPENPSLRWLLRCQHNLLNCRNAPPSEENVGCVNSKIWYIFHESITKNFKGCK